MRFVNLQVGASSGQAVGLADLSALLPDYAETAALVAGLDLVIAVDTSVAHLAGALGVPVWLLLPYAPDWRWLLGRTDSPWYRSIRIFRQDPAGRLARRRRAGRAGAFATTERGVRLTGNPLSGARSQSDAPQRKAWGRHS